MIIDTEDDRTVIMLALMAYARGKTEERKQGINILADKVEMAKVAVSTESMMGR